MFEYKYMTTFKFILVKRYKDRRLNLRPFFL